MKEAKPILIVKLNYDLEPIQAELIERTTGFNFVIRARTGAI